MSQSSGPSFNDFGLVFGYDTSDTVNSFKGEPTTNIAYASHPNLTSNSNWWFNSGESILLNNDTSIPKPIIPNVDTTNLHIFSSEVTVVGNQHIGSAIVPISPSTQYTMSIYYWFQGSSMQTAPYLRTAVNNSLVVPFNYNGDTNYLNWPRGKWIRLSATYTTPSNETGIYMTSYTGDFVGEKVAYFGYQVEQKDHMTPLVLGTRGSTQTIIDVSGNRTITADNVTFNSSGEMVFDGTNDFLSVGSFNLYSMGNSTLEAVIYMNNLSSPDSSYSIFGGVSDEGYHGYHEIRNSGSGYKMTFWTATDGWRYGNTALSSGTWYHVTWVWNHRTLTFYLNGVPDGSFTFTTFSPYGLGFNRISSFPNERYMNGKIPVAKVYDTSLSATDVLKSFNNYKKRYNM
jgi:hypothetical protein